MERRMQRIIGAATLLAGAGALAGFQVAAAPQRAAMQPQMQRGACANPLASMLVAHNGQSVKYRSEIATIAEVSCDGVKLNLGVPANAQGAANNPSLDQLWLATNSVAALRVMPHGDTPGQSGKYEGLLEIFPVNGAP